MKLHELSDYKALNEVLLRMGISTNEMIPFKIENITLKTTEKFNWNLEKGLEVSEGQISVAKDNTLEFNGQKIAAYILDKRSYKNKKTELPRVHLYDCRTLKDMRRDKKYDRYVATRDFSGDFRVRIDGKERREKLNVCKNCLNEMNFNSYSSLSKPEQEKMVLDFDIKYFFTIYNSQLKDIPIFSESTYPENEYGPKFDYYSRMFRASKNWTCEECRINLKEKQNFLHTHHINANKHWNFPNNLKALCVRCHSEQPGHSHMRKLPHYSEFLVWKRDNE